MEEKEFRKLVKEELNSIIKEKKLFEVDVPKKLTNDLFSKIYIWIMRGEITKAIQAIKHDPELEKLVKNNEILYKKIKQKMETDDSFLKFALNMYKELDR